LDGLAEDGQRHRRKHRARGDEEVKLGHGASSEVRFAPLRDDLRGLHGGDESGRRKQEGRENKAGKLGGARHWTILKSERCRCDEVKVGGR
jgi:hypothetical protein